MSLKELNLFFDNQLVKTQGDSSGSGFFISTDGYIITNNHVVGGAVTVDVFIGEERNSFKAKIVGTSECDDIAVLKIDLPVGGAFYFFDEKNPVVGEIFLLLDFLVEINYLFEWYCFKRKSLTNGHLKAHAEQTA